MSGKAIKLVRIPLLAVWTLCLSGCIFLPIPHEEWCSSHFHGTVVDSTSGLPLKGVKITLRDYRHSENEIGPVVVESDQSGHYSVLASRHAIWLPIWLGPAEGAQGGVVTFERDGYVTAEAKKGIFGGAMGRTEFEVNVRLKKKEPN